MPLFETGVGPVWDGQRLVRGSLVLRAKTQNRRHEVPDDLTIKSVPGDGDAIIAHDHPRARSVVPGAGADRENGKVARAATEVPDQDQLVMSQRLFITVCRRYRFVLED